MKDKHTIYISSGYVYAVNQKTGVHDWGHGEVDIALPTIKQIEFYRRKYPNAQVIDLEPDLFSKMFKKMVKLTKENKKLKEKQICLNLPFVKDLVEKLKTSPQEIINENKFMSVRWQ